MAEKIQRATKTTDAKKENSVSQTRQIDPSRTINSPVDQILHLQRTIGNQAVQRLIKSGTLQAKLKIGQPGDRYEREADRVAEKVMCMPEPGVRRQVEPEEEEEETLQSKPLVNQITPLVQVQRQEEPGEEEEMLQAKPLAGQITPLVQRQVQPEEEEEEEMLQAKSREDATSEVPNDLESQINAIKSGGHPLPESTRSFFEPRFGRDFNQIRVHTDAKATEAARAVNARVFTAGRDVVFGKGEYTPDTTSGKHLMAHELTHVVQQSGGLLHPQIQRMDDSSQLPSGVSIQMQGGFPNPILPKPVRVIPCTTMPSSFERGVCGSDEVLDFNSNDFPPLTGTNAAKRAAVWEADNLTLDFQLRNRMRLELGGLGGAQGLRMVTRFSGGTGKKLTHYNSDTLGADALVSGTFLRLHESVIGEIQRQIAFMRVVANVIDCNRITLPTAGVPVVEFGFSDGIALKGIIGGTQGLSISIKRISFNPGYGIYHLGRSFDIELQYLICDNFGVDNTDLYTPGLVAFWVLQHRRSGHKPFINELNLTKTERWEY